MHPTAPKATGVGPISISAAHLDLMHSSHGTQGAVLLDPYATAIIGRREFGKLGLVSILSSIDAVLHAPACIMLVPQPNVIAHLCMVSTSPPPASTYPALSHHHPWSFCLPLFVAFNLTICLCWPGRMCSMGPAGRWAWLARGPRRPAACPPPAQRPSTGRATAR